MALYMRQTDDPMVMAGPLFQPIRGVLFGFVFYLLRDSLFGRKNGGLVMWAVLVVVGTLFVVLLLLPILGILAA